MSDPHQALEGIPAPAARAAGLTPGHTHCANCGAELLGPYCYRCGQPTKHMLKHLPALAADATDAVFNIDGRIMRTLPALYFRPGFLAREYFAGRRMRYVPPFRLMFFMSVLAFLLIHVAIMMDQSLAQTIATVGGESTPAEVHKDTRDALASIAAARAKPDMSPIGQLALGLAAHAVPINANERLRDLGAPPLPATSVPAAPSTAAVASQLDAIANAPSADAVKARADAYAVTIATAIGKVGASSKVAVRWLGQLEEQVKHARKQGLKRAQHGGNAPAGAAPSPRVSVPVPSLERAARGDRTRFKFGTVHIGWLPAFLNNRINDGLQQAQANLTELTYGAPQARSQARRRVIRNFLSVLPPTLFVLMPLVALLLTLMYVFKSRLYIEHLIVTLYSHAFIFTTLFLSVLLAMIASKLTFIQAPAQWLQALLWIWLPVYLLVMQKRVYAQGWFFTVVKYCATGVCYFILLSLALAAAAVIGLAQ